MTWQVIKARSKDYIGMDNGNAGHDTPINLTSRKAAELGLTYGRYQWLKSNNKLGDYIRSRQRWGNAS